MERNRDAYTTSVGGRVKALRTAHQMNQQELASAAGVSQPTISRIERGEGPVDATVALRLATALQVQLGTITGVGSWEGRVATAGRTDMAESLMDEMRCAAVDYLDTHSRVTRNP